MGNAVFESMQSTANSKLRADQNKIESNEINRQKNEIVFDNVMETASKLAQSGIENHIEQEVSKFQSELALAEAKGTFGYIGMDPKNGLALSPEEYWSNVEAFRDNYISEHGAGFLGGTGKAINKYVSNSQQSMLSNYSYKKWDETRTIALDLISTSTTSNFDSKAFEDQMNVYISKLELDDWEGLNSSDLGYGIQDNYNYYLEEKAKFEVGNPVNDYNNACRKLAMSVGAKSNSISEDLYYSTLLSAETNGAFINASIIDSAYSAIAIEGSDSLDAAWDLSYGSEDGAKKYIESLQNKGTCLSQNGESISLDTEEKKKLWNDSISTAVQERWATISYEQTTKYNSFVEQMNNAKNADGSPKIFTSVEDELAFRDSLGKDYSTLRDSTIKYNVSTSKANLYAQRTYSKNLYSHGYTLAYDNDPEKRKEAAAWLAVNDLNKDANRIFGLGSDLLSRDDDNTEAVSTNYVTDYNRKIWSSIKDKGITDPTKEQFVEMALQNLNVGTVSYPSDTKSSSSKSADSSITGSSVAEDLISMDSADNFFDVAYEAFSAGKDVKEALKEAGYDTDDNTEIWGNVYKYFEDANSYAKSTSYSASDKKAYAKNMYDTYISGWRGNNVSKDLVAQKSTLAFESDPVHIGLGYMIMDNTNAGGAYNPEVTSLIVDSNLSTTLNQYRIDGDIDGLLQFGKLVLSDEEYSQLERTVDGATATTKNGKVLPLKCDLSELTALFSDGYIDFCVAICEGYKGAYDLGATWVGAGNYETVEDAIKGRFSSAYQEASDAYLEPIYSGQSIATTGKIEWGAKYNGIEASQSLINKGKLGGENHSIFKRALALATDEYEYNSILYEAQFHMTSEAYKDLKNTPQINLVIQSLGIDAYQDFSIGDLVERVCGKSTFSDLQKNPLYSDWVDFLVSDSSDLIDTFKTIASDTSLIQTQKQAMVKEAVVKNINTLMLYSSPADIAINSTFEASSNGTIDYLQELKELGSISDTKWMAEDAKKITFFKDFKGVLDTTSSPTGITWKYVDNVFTASSSNPNMQRGLQILSDISDGASAIKDGELATTLICSAMAYYGKKGQDIPDWVVNPENYSKANISETSKTMTRLISSMDETNISVWKDTTKGVYDVATVLTKTKKLGIGGVVTYQNGHYYSSTLGELTYNGDILSASVNGKSVGDISFYVDNVSTKDIATSVLPRKNDGTSIIGDNTGSIVGLTLISQANFTSDVVKNVKEYNEIAEAVLNNSDNALIVFPNSLKIGTYEVESHASQDFYQEHPDYRIERYTEDSVKLLYKYYLDNGFKKNADNLLDQLSEDMASRVREVKASDQNTSEMTGRLQPPKGNVDSTKTKQATVNTYMEHHSNDANVSMEKLSEQDRKALNTLLNDDRVDSDSITKWLDKKFGLI